MRILSFLPNTVRIAGLGFAPQPHGVSVSYPNAEQLGTVECGDVVIPTFAQGAADLTGLPMQEDGTLLFVVNSVFTAAPWRTDLATPFGRPVYDAQDGVMCFAGLITR